MSKEKPRVFRGVRTPIATTVTLDGKPLDPRFNLRNHSPAGFNWGYGGSGPAQLALAMIAAVVDDEHLVMESYQDFKWGIVAAFRADVWELSYADVTRWVAEWKRRNVYQPLLVQ